MASAGAMDEEDLKDPDLADPMLPPEEYKAEVDEGALADVKVDCAFSLKESVVIGTARESDGACDAGDATNEPDQERSTGENAGGPVNVCSFTNREVDIDKNVLQQVFRTEN